MLRARWVVLACLASCGVRAPAPVDVDAMLRTRGPIEARRDLVIRVTADPRDVAGRLALAALDERIHRPSEAIEALEVVVGLGGPFGVRWHPEDQARLARLIAARGRARLARGAASAQADLERARRLGAEISDDELRGARIAGAIAALRHSDTEVREGGRRVLAEQVSAIESQRVSRSASDDTASRRANPMNPTGDDASLRDDHGGGGAADGAPEEWRGARPGATAEQRARFGVWLWRQGAKRAAWDELRAWHGQVAPPRDRELEDAYLTAARWWIPLDQPGPPVEEMGGAMRCAFAVCAPREVVGDDARERAYLLGPLPPPVREPEDAAALVVITLHQALRGEVSWGAALAARLDLAALGESDRLAQVPELARPTIGRLVGREVRTGRAAATADQRLVIAAERVLAGGGAGEIAGLLDGARYAEMLRAMVEPRAPFAGDARAEAVARHASRVVPGTASVDELRAIAAAFARDPAIADRLAGDAVAGASDAAAMHATLGGLFDAIGDPARARAAWQAAVNASAEPRFVRGLAEAQARQGDGDAALVHATSAAAASGDPAVVWTAVAQALVGSGRHVHALEAARGAIDLAGPETLAAALDAAIAASRALGREAQAAGLAARRARIGPGAGLGRGLGDRDPTDALAALDAHRRQTSAATIARLWVASRWNPRSVELRAALLAVTPPGDPRRAVITGELVDLAGDGDALGRAAAAALR